jgi:predicted DNA-binding protein (MmcQ/YjbR family)
VDLETFRSHCLSLKGVTEEFPFDKDTLVFKVKGRMFALTDINLFESINLKCDPEKAVELRDRFPAVLPGYHMNKKHWNTILMNGSVPDRLVLDWVSHSYELVVENLSASDKLDLANNI